MNTKPVLKIVSCLAALFMLGGVCGYGLSARSTPPRADWKSNPKWAERWLELRMAEDFSAIAATPEQQAQLRPSYDRLLSDFNAIQLDAARQVNDAFKKHGLEVRRQLTPEQREVMQKLNQERMSRSARKSTEPTQP